MEYQKLINLLDNLANQPSQFRARNWVEINDDSHGKYDTGNLIRFITSVIRSILCEYSNACIHVKGTITIPNTAATGTATNDARKKWYLKILLHLVIA